MQKTSIILAVVAVFGLAGCLENDAERAVAGAGIGLLGAEVLDIDPTTGALLGAAGGAYCLE